MEVVQVVVSAVYSGRGVQYPSIPVSSGRVPVSEYPFRPGEDRSRLHRSRFLQVDTEYIFENSSRDLHSIHFV